MGKSLLTTCYWIRKALTQAYQARPPQVRPNPLGLGCTACWDHWLQASLWHWKLRFGDGCALKRVEFMDEPLIPRSRRQQEDEWLSNVSVELCCHAGY
jgi:hypothetical protein